MYIYQKSSISLIMEKKRYFSLRDLPLPGKTVLLRVDYNVPLKNGTVVDNSKIIASLPTIEYLLEQNCRIVLATHLGDPQGKVVPELKTNPLAKELEKLLKAKNSKFKVVKLDDCIGNEVKKQIKKQISTASSKSSSQIFFLENLRFYKEEEENDLMFAHSLANLAEVYVNDGFGVSHRNHASVSAIANFLPAAAGFLMEKEISNLSQAFSPLHPNIWIMGGAKLDKIDLINQALESADYLLIGGALAFTFLKAQGIPVGMSKVDSASLPLAKQLLEKYAKKIVLPADFVVSESFSPKAKVSIVPFNHIGSHRVALDIGPDTVHKFWEHLQKAKLIVWNGPLGYFEWEKFSHGTREVGRLLGKLPEAVKLAGGGETVAAIHKFRLEHNFTHLSTGGGASLQFLSGKKLPGVMALEENWKKFKDKIQN